MHPASRLQSIVLHATNSLVRPHRSADWRKRGRPHAVEELERRVMLSTSYVFPFAAQLTFAVGQSPTAITTADLNHDAEPDVIVANSAANSISNLLGNGDGTFKPQTVIPLAGSPSSLAVADINGDARPDLIVTDKSNNLVDVLMGNGDGTFASPLTFATGTNPASIAIADINRDGKPDLLYANSADNTIGVMPGNGDGTFQPQSTFATGSNPVSISLGDANRDGKVDVAVANFTGGTIGVLLGNGDGSFAPQQTYSAGGQPGQVVFDSATIPSHPSIYYFAVGLVDIEVLMGNGDGTFRGHSNLVYEPETPTSMVIADMDGDGSADVVTTDPKDSGVSVAGGVGGGGFARTGASPYGIAVADINGDVRRDIVVTNNADNTISVLLGDAPPTVLSINRSPADPITSSNMPTWVVTFSKPVTGVDLSDFTVTTSGTSANSLSITPVSASVYDVTAGISGIGQITLNLVDNGKIHDLLGNPLQPGGNIVSYSTLHFASAPFVSAPITAADLNGDGIPDLIGGGGVGILLGNGNGTFKTPYPADPYRRASSIATADVNGDGIPDLEVTPEGYAYVQVLLGNGDGTFRAPLSFASYGSSITAADVNGDGKVDLVVNEIYGGPASPGAVGLMLGNGDGTFQSEQTFTTGASSMAVADINGDGRIDFVAVTQGGTVSVLLGNGNGTFATPQTMAVNRFAESIAIADFNGDGKPDLVVSGINFVSLLIGNGDGAFQPQQTYLVIGDLSQIVTADVNGDGKEDLLFNNGSDTVGVLVGNGDGSFVSEQSFPMSLPNTNLEGGLLVSDFNRDGRPDLLAYADSGWVEVFLGNTTGSAVGQTFSYVPYMNTINGGTGVHIVLEAGGKYIDFDQYTPATGFVATGRMAIDDPAGLTINSTAADFGIFSLYGAPLSLPNILHLNGTFTTQLLGTNPLANTTIDLGSTSTLYILYQGVTDPIASMKSALSAGYNQGTWTGSGTTTGAITSSAAAFNPGRYSLGYADSADGTGVNTTPNSVEIKYTLTGDANLDGKVDIFDLNTLLPHFNSTGPWTAGDFTYDGKVDVFDLNALLPNYNQSLPALSTSATQQTAAASAPTAASAQTIFSASPVTQPDDSPQNHPNPWRRHRMRKQVL
jgi:VCBS repeat protein/FG-GAP repeat protein